ncbi:uncharacterized protein BJ171DRAFT_61645 [Polychytrium aggregatum]|uniref:uncharacterized protein n=1 Tax=Polychytrium aggregatum TaxID=110093 RepID=UPI0022FDD083|nr:uncharacterized protein BJ171DRAFT_61645 [Polychytrium aggregatum]KAI9205477.1 hypothetical protein BJ171DRAFT_61645 [Polychytrium aggregatum]
MEGDSTCRVCREAIQGPYLSAAGKSFHPGCFVCFQCLEPFPDGQYYEAGDSVYCEFDYGMLHGSRCGRCGEIIRGKITTALDMKWHPEHFTCEGCSKLLAGSGFLKYKGKPYCKPCHQKAKEKDIQLQGEICERCKKHISKGDMIVLKGQKFHSHHFSCCQCKKQLEVGKFKEHEGKLYCLEDYALATTQTCDTCKQTIIGRSVAALGKVFHPEHFVCSECQQPFAGTSFWEHEMQVYCETHYNERIGAMCATCYEPASAAAGAVIETMKKKFCANHFICFTCHRDLTAKGARYFEFDRTPLCKRCFEKLPSKVRKSINKYAEIERKVAELEEKEKRAKK